MDNVPSTPESRRKRLAPLAFGAAGLIGGVIISTTMGANAATTATPTPSVTAGGSAATTAPDSTDSTTAPEATEPKRGGGGTETTVTGTKADSVKAAVLAKYPGATVTLVESDSNGGYEAEITTSAGASIHVSVSDTFVVGAERGGPGGHGGRGFGGHSNTDPAHEAAESPARAAQEKADDAAAAATATPSPAATS